MNVETWGALIIAFGIGALVSAIVCAAYKNKAEPERGTSSRVRIPDSWFV